ncbi:DUF1559 domain-containing protein [Bremerella cremea]|uniref:DUF1559 domain-containing protein n=1 Tax=Bremerella cremea TaxID=1031537 RepID=A0A368KJD9_9BACT|nr:DUF1559 domain-containing protein [Bremerella cremea]RCS40672.1 DUF1559 domain-containing protein [Bremerella cremea]
MNDINVPTNKKLPAPLIFAAAGLAGIVLALIYFFIVTPMVAAYQEQVTINQMKQIALAMHHYLDANQVFPQAAVLDETGKPVRSWRATVCYVDESDLFQQYDRQQSWDSPDNLRFAKETPQAFRSPQCDCSEGKTPFVVVVGPNTMFPSDQQTKFRDCTDGSSNTLLLIADLENPVPWSEPKDLSLVEFLQRRSSQVSDQKPLYVSLVDASTFRVTKITPKDLENLTVRNDGHVTSFEGRAF